MIIVLAKILTPADFGVVGTGTIFMALFMTVQNFGILQAVVQRDTRIEDSISAGLTIRWLIGGSIAFTVIIFSPMISDFFGNAAISPVLIVLSLNLFIPIFGFSSQVLLTRSLDFYHLALAGIMQSIVTFFFSVGTAMIGFSFWSLVIGTISGSIAYVVALRKFNNAHFKPKLDMNLMKEIIRFGGHVLITNIMAFVIFNFDQIAIGKMLGLTSLGIYLIAIKFGRLLGEQIAGTVNRVLFPTMARIKDNISLLRNGYILSLRMIAIASVPLSFGLSALSHFFIVLILGPSWISAVIPLSILAFQGLLNALITPAGNVLVSIGKPKHMSIPATYQAIAIVVGIYPAVQLYGINGACLWTTFVSLGVLLYILVVLSKNLGVSIFEVARPMMPALASGTIMFFFLILTTQIIPSTIVTFIAEAIAGLLLYIGFLHLFSKGRDVRDFLSMMKRLKPSYRKQ